MPLGVDVSGTKPVSTCNCFLKCTWWLLRSFPPFDLGGNPSCAAFPWLPLKWTNLRVYLNPQEMWKHDSWLFLTQCLSLSSRIWVVNDIAYLHQVSAWRKRSTENVDSDNAEFQVIVTLAVDLGPEGSIGWLCDVPAAYTRAKQEDELYWNERTVELFGNETFLFKTHGRQV